MQSDDRSKDAKASENDAALEARMIRIMQYCDGVLPAREAALVAEEIARDPEAARLASELTAGADAARTAWGHLETEPVSLALARRVTQAARAPARRGRTGTGAPNWRMAAAVVVGVALGMLGLFLAQQGSEQGLRLAGSNQAQETAQVSDVAWQPALMNVLAKDPEAASVTFGGENAVSVARWFDTAAGLRCAEFSKSRAGAVIAGGVACKKSDGGWDVIEQPR